MSKLLLLVCIALLVGIVITAAPDKATCGRHGDPCISDRECCDNTKCHKYARRCQVQITAAEIMAQREKILGRRGKDYRK